MDTTETAHTDLITDLSTNLYEAKSWIRIVGVLSIIAGVLTALSLWGILICWLPIWMGIMLTRVAGRIEMAYLKGDAAMFREATDNLRKFFTITGIAALIYLLFVGIFIVVTIMASGFAWLGNMN